MQLNPGELFNQRYRLLRQIGVGGFSEVWLVSDEKAGDFEIALKVYAPDRGLDKHGIVQFQQEYVVTANLNHSGLLKASFFDVTDGSPFLILPFCRRGSLSSLIFEKGSFTEREIAEVIHQCSDALKYLHSKEILHQDIKPDNILINDEGKYLLTDFGISSRMRSTLRKSTNTQKALTLAYAPPERFAARQESLPAGDIFSMGITIYELATGDVPWMGAGGSVIKADTEAPLLPDDYSIGLVRLMQKCLHYDPSLRPTAEELHNVTGQYLRTGSWPDDRRPKGRATEIITPSDKKQEKKESEKKKEQPSVRKTEKKKAIKPISGQKRQQYNKPKKDSVIGRRVKQKRKALISVIIVLTIIIGTIITVQLWPPSDSQLATADLQSEKNPKYVLTDSASSETDPGNIDVNNPNASEQKEGETTNERNEPVENNNPIETNNDPPQIIEDQAEDTSNNIEESNQEVPDESIEETESNQAAGDTAAVGDLEMIDDSVLEEEEKFNKLPIPIKELLNNMVFVEGGTFIMGCTADQADDCENDEDLTQTVTLNSFKIGKYEVTQGQWEAVMGSTVRQQRIKASSTWSLAGEGSDYPIYFVRWNDANEFIKKLNQITGQEFRLPTEAEWEYAARGGQSSRGYKYAGSNTIEIVAWFKDNSSGTTHPVGQKQANELGLYDMSGNVFEWCQDWYGGYEGGNKTNPSGPSSGSVRVYRGGCWRNPYYKIRSANRNDYGDRYGYVGFRVVSSI